MLHGRRRQQQMSAAIRDRIVANLILLVVTIICVVAQGLVIALEALVGWTTLLLIIAVFNLALLSRRSE
jgi:1,4-dihydroxy-2-naphthoate octaprenyltransferase